MGRQVAIACAVLGALACGAPPLPPSASASQPRAAEGKAAAPDRRGNFDPRPYYDKRALYVLEGVASWYGEDFAGRSTANGEVYDPNEYTAAHRTLPFGTILRVTRKKTGDWVLVRINDRGPYGKRKRLLDLSRQAAKRLGMLHDGVAQVRAEVLELGEKRTK
ncbi:MAG TPA: septal ring lytic transglycosylase RlpA family protein [Polyangiales bacterium]|nr:septal ring lytic transglycosylase RlpA family protein [Polyangiales bacterium]